MCSDDLFLHGTRAENAEMKHGFRGSRDGHAPAYKPGGATCSLEGEHCTWGGYCQHLGQRKEQGIGCRHDAEIKGSPVSIGASNAPIGVESTSEGSDMMCS